MNFTLHLYRWMLVAALGHPALDVQPVNAHPGDPVLITVSGEVSEASGTLGKQPLHFYDLKRGAQALTVLPVDAAEGQWEVVVEAKGAKSAATLHGKLTVAPAHFSEKQLTVDSKFVEKPPPEVEKRMREDHAAFAQAFKQPFVPRLFGGDFIWPRPQQVTAPFGELRLFNGKKNSQHYGLDLKGKTGEPVLAANEGVVVMARDCYASGNTVVLHHGGQLFTLYLHLSKMTVEVGQHVARGAPLGRVGASGRVTGPHLHWAVKVGEHYASPEGLMRLHFAASKPKSR